MDTHKIEIRRCSVEKTLLAVEKVLAEKGYAGTPMGNTAEEAELPRSNLHYYFNTKDELYCGVLLGLLEVWKQDVLCFGMFDDPRVVLTSYIHAEMSRSRTRPHGFKVWVNEIMHGASLFSVTLDDSLYEWAKMREAKIRQWVEEKRILSIESSSLLCMIWVSTQCYADSGYQVEMLNDHQLFNDMRFERAVQTVTSVVLREIGLEP